MTGAARGTVVAPDFPYCTSTVELFDSHTTRGASHHAVSQHPGARGAPNRPRDARDRAPADRPTGTVALA